MSASCCAVTAISQPFFQASLQAGVALPVNNDGALASYAGNGIQFGNHLDYLYGNNAFYIGLGAYMGQLTAGGTSDDYKIKGQELARRSGLAPSQLTFTESAFKSTHILAGPVAAWKKNNWRINIWTKGGYGFNEPGRYAVISKENGQVSNILVNQSGDNKNGWALNMGAGIRLDITSQLGLQLAGNYFSTKTDQVNYSFDREKGLTPLFYTATNQFIQASVGLQFDIGGGDGKQTKAGISTSHSNVRTKRSMAADTSEPAAQRINKSKSNVKNNRQAGSDNDKEEDNDNALFFVPEKIELRSEPNSTGGDAGRVQLNAVNNYLTAFAYQINGRPGISQCGASAMPGDPIPGLDVKLKRMGTAGNDILSARTNKDGSFAFNNVEPGNYNAFIGNDTMPVAVNRASSSSNNYRLLEVEAGSCSNAKANYVITVDGKLYAEVITAREAGSGMATGRVLPTVNKKNDIAIDEQGVHKTVAPRDVATGMSTGKRMHKPLLVANTDFDINWDNVIKNDNKLYAEVITAREASSGMATGRTLITGDVDGDGYNDVVAPGDVASGMATGRLLPTVNKKNGIAIDEPGVQRTAAPRDVASGMPTGKRMHKPFVVRIDPNTDGDSYEILSPRDAASGQASGRRMHKPFLVSIDPDNDDDDAVMTNRDQSTGLATGKRMHKPMVIRITPGDEGDNYEIVAPRDIASGMPTGKRMHKPFVITVERETDDMQATDRDQATGLATGKRMHKPFVVRVEGENGTNYEVVAPRDAASGQASGRRQYQPVVIRHEGITYQIAMRDAASGRPTGKRSAGAPDQSYEPWDNDTEQDVVTNPLYESGGNSGHNPMHESKDLHVVGNNGTEHDIFIPDVLAIKLGNHPNVVTFYGYEVVPVKWAAPESIPNNSMKTFNQNASRSNHTRLAATSTGDNNEPAKTVNTSRGNIKHMSRINCNNGICTIECVVEVDGNEYDAMVTGTLKTKHDTVKNSINNIR